MGTFDRLKGALRANLNDLMDRAGETPGSVRRALVELEEAVRESRTQVREAAHHLAEIEREAERARAASAEAEKAAMSALRAGDEALARRHLEHKLKRDAEARELAPILDRERAWLEELRAGVAALEAKLEAARAKVAAAQASEADQAAGTWSERIERLEAEAQVLKDLWRERVARGPSEPPKVDDELRHLKDELDKKK
jgi:phage shock protein A